jgi:hypothetical protein
MTVDIRDLPTASVHLPMYVDCFDRRTGDPKRQKFAFETRIAVDGHGLLPTICETTGLSWAGVQGRWDYTGAGGRTYVPFRARYGRIDGAPVASSSSLSEEVRRAGGLLAGSGWGSATNAARRVFDDWHGPHRSTGLNVDMDRDSSRAVAPDPARWRFDERAQACIEDLRRFAFENAIVGPQGLMIQQPLPVWIVDPGLAGVKVTLRHVDDWFDGNTPWAFSAGRLDDALRFQAALVRLTGKPAVAPVGTVALAAGWDLRNDKIELALALAKTRVADLDRHVASLPRAAVGLWHDLRSSIPVVEAEGEPAARRALADFLALRTAVGSGCRRGGALAEWVGDTSRHAARIAEVEGIATHPALSAEGPRP